MAEDLLKKHGSIYVTGDLVHNSVVMDRLEDLGLNVLDENALPQGAVVLIQAHGAPSGLIESLKDMGNEIIDGTCPIVKKSFNTVLKSRQKGFKNLVFGKRTHPEMMALKSLVPEAEIFEDRMSLERLLKENQSERTINYAFTAQTTKPLSIFTEFASRITASLFMFQSVIVYNTICDATISREKEIRDKALVADCVIIIGGRKSSNTRKLYEIARAVNKNSFLVHGRADIEEIKDKIYQFNNVVLGSGTSTPMQQVEEIQNYISSGM
jgi:4-hydroxy-3-methylbut-2-enyl diphosphate reductase